MNDAPTAEYSALEAAIYGAVYAAWMVDAAKRGLTDRDDWLAYTALAIRDAKAAVKFHRDALK